MRKTTTMVAAASAFALTLGLAACSQGGDDSVSSASSATDGTSITYVLPTSWASVPALTSAVEDFNAANDITVTLQAVPDENYNSVVGSRLAGGTDIDIFAGSYTLFDVPNVMVDLSGEDFTSRMPKASIDSITFSDGKIYSYPSPTPGASFGVFYNKKVFEAAKITTPATLDELTAAMKTLKDSGVAPLYLAGKDGWTLLQHRNATNPLMNLSGDTIGKLNSNSIRWDAIPELKDQYTALAQWAENGYLNDNVLTATYEESLQNLVDGKAGMIINGTWVIGALADLNESAKDTIGFFPLPSKDGKTMLGVSGADGLHIAKSSANIDAAKKFLAFLSSKEIAQKFMDGAPGISNFTDVTVPDSTPVAMKEVSEAIANGDTTLAIDKVSLVPAPETDLIAAYQQLVAGKMSADEFLTAEAEGMIASGKAAGIEGF
ncbi:ABC transporter substrate-binding protein [Schaalia canis]|uniref:Extracellular solute-binding protein n=1 Tax=Schaalia canis TaxID=100469 RepID=A0A3P1SBZ3_9ACTO|nr:extracellular solute-binding protein [Schaalia canis]RRC94574.1 extracellular solute-binding protein [Schaalia canis]